MMVVAVEGDPSNSVSPPRVLFEGQYARLPSDARNYDVTPDADRFLMLKSLSVEQDLVLVQNWHEELKRLVPLD